MSPSPRPRRRPDRPRASRRARDLASTAAFVLCALAARSSLADHYVVPSGSMLPTVQEGDHIAVDKRAFGLRVPFSNLYLSGTGPSRFDVVVLESPEDGRVLLKRVVALPGDRVAVRGGRIVVEGVPAELTVDGDEVREVFGARSHPLGLASGAGPDLEEVEVPPGAYLVLGDHRGNSHDGRAFGLVPREAVLGRAAGVFLRRGSLVWQRL